MNNNKEYIDNLIARHLTGELTSTEEQELLLWRKESPSNEDYYSETKRVLHLSLNHYKKSTGELAIDLEAEWALMKKHIDTPPKTQIIPIYQKKWFSFAASAILLVVAGWAIFTYFGNNDIHTLATTSFSLEETLPDGSIVTLNSNSQLIYNESFNMDKREVFLTGEGYFAITPNKEKPFLIHANNILIEVVGTSFNVNAYPHQDQIEVVVSTGLVKLIAPEINKEVLLNPGEKGIFSQGNREISSSMNSNVNYDAWKTRRIVFESSNLTSVLQTLNAVYHTNIILASGISDNCPVSVTFDNQDLDSVLKVLEATLNLTYTNSGGQIIITATGC